MFPVGLDQPIPIVTNNNTYIPPRYTESFISSLLPLSPLSPMQIMPFVPSVINIPNV
jgi:hypothetical protein